jgi:DNA replication protein DnaC
MMTIEDKMRKLRLGGMAKKWREVKYKSTEKYIDELLEIELAEREINTINRKIKNARFSVIKTLDEFVWHNGIQIPDGITQESIENFDFVGKKENLIFLGSVGTGKTHLASAITLNACKNGKSARFFTAAELANLLIANLQAQVASLTAQNQDLREQLRQERQHNRAQADRITELAADMAKLASNAQQSFFNTLASREAK